jgi:hypothetical protein
MSRHCFTCGRLLSTNPNDTSSYRTDGYCSARCKRKGKGQVIEDNPNRNMENISYYIDLRVYLKSNVQGDAAHELANTLQNMVADVVACDHDDITTQNVTYEVVRVVEK